MGKPLLPEERLARLRGALERVGASRRPARLLARLGQASLLFWAAGGILVKADGFRPLAGYLGLSPGLSDLEAAQRLLRRGREEELGLALLRQAADSLGHLAEAVALVPKGRLALEPLEAPPEPWASLGWGLALTPELLGLFFPGPLHEEPEDLFADPWA